MGFLNGLFLAATATALVPVIIHLVQRRRVQQVVFGSLRFLRKTSHRVVRRRRFEEILLVVLRALALAVLALAFARPFFARRPEDRVSGRTFVGQEAVLVLLDNSYSMRAEGRLERAKEEALKFIGQADASAKIGVAAFSSQFQELCPIGSTPRQAEEAIEKIKPSWRGTKLALALDQANRVLTRAGREEERRLIVLISDFQDSSWEKRGEWALAPGIKLSLRNVGAPAGSPGRGFPNVFVGRVAVPRLVVAGGFVEVISATVHNAAKKPLADARVVFRAHQAGARGEEKAALSVNLRPGEEAPVRFRHKFTEPGDVTGTISMETGEEAPEGKLPEHQTAHFCVHVTPRVNVLLVNADRSEKTVLNDGLFVKTALVPSTEGVVSPFEVREAAPEEMKPADLEGVDVVLFANVSKLPPAITDVPSDRRGSEGAEFHSPLGRFVAAGGGIGFLCGSKVVPEDFNRTFGGLAPCKLLRRATQEGDPPVVINQVDLRHEIFAEFAQPRSGDFSLAEFSQYFLVTDSLRAQVPARFSHRDAHPALLERVFGQEGANDDKKLRPKGKSLLFVSSMDLEWNNLCLKSVFVPFVHQVTKRLCSRRTGSVRNFTAGDDVTCHLPEDAGEVKLRRQGATVGSPNRARVPRLARPAVAQENGWEELRELKPRAVGGAKVVSFAPEEGPGIYEVAYKGGSARFAINLDPGEPDLRPLDTNVLLATVQKGPAVDVTLAPGATQVVAHATAGARIEERQRVWWYLAVAALAILGAEMALAMHIGRA